MVDINGVAVHRGPSINGVFVNYLYGPFKHAFKCIAKYVAAAWKIRNAYAHPSDVA